MPSIDTLSLAGHFDHTLWRQRAGILEFTDTVGLATASIMYLGLCLLGVLGSVINWGSAQVQHTIPAALLGPRYGGLGCLDSHKDGLACQPDSFSRISTSGRVDTLVYYVH